MLRVRATAAPHLLLHVVVVAAEHVDVSLRAVHAPTVVARPRVELTKVVSRPCSHDPSTPCSSMVASNAHRLGIQEGEGLGSGSGSGSLGLLLKLPHLVLVLISRAAVAEATGFGSLAPRRSQPMAACRALTLPSPLKVVGCLIIEPLAWIERSRALHACSASPKHHTEQPAKGGLDGRCCLRTRSGTRYCVVSSLVSTQVSTSRAARHAMHMHRA